MERQSGRHRRAINRLEFLHDSTPPAQERLGPGVSRCNAYMSRAAHRGEQEIRCSTIDGQQLKCLKSETFPRALS